MTFDRENDLKIIEERINRISEVIAADAEETVGRRRRIEADRMKDFDLYKMGVEYEAALHIVRTYEMRRERHYLETRIRGRNIVSEDKLI